MATVYRVSNDHRLPLHWAYSDAWELEYDEETDESYWADQRSEGAQVWEDLADIVLATYFHSDGTYGPEEYNYLLVIDTPRASHVEGLVQWPAITEATRVRSLLIDDLHDWLASHDVDDHDTATDWLDDDDNLRTLEGWLNETAEEEPIEWYESLPAPGPTRVISADGSEQFVQHPIRD